MITGDKELVEALQRRLPKALQWTTAVTLTRLAQLSREEIPGVIADKMTLRSPGLVKSQTRWKMARGSAPINRQVAYVYTIATKDNFTGWIEQPTRGIDRRLRKWTRMARTGGVKKVKGKYRFKKGREIPKLMDKKGMRLGNARRWVQMIEYYDEPILVPRKISGIYPGVIAFMRSKHGTHFKIKRLANVENYNVEKVDILGLAYNRVKSQAEWIFMNNFIKQIKRL